MTAYLLDEATACPQCQRRTYGHTASLVVCANCGHRWTVPARAKRSIRRRASPQQCKRCPEPAQVRVTRAGIVTLYCVEHFYRLLDVPPGSVISWV